MTVVHSLRPVFRIPDDLVDEITEMQHESEPFICRGAFVFVDHAAIGILRALICILATDKSEGHRPGIVLGGRGDGAADTAAIAAPVGEAIPVNVGWPETANKNAASPVRIGRKRCV